MVSLLPARNCTGTATAPMAAIADGFVSAAAIVVSTATRASRLAASTAAPPPIECPLTPSLVPATSLPRRFGEPP